MTNVKFTEGESASQSYKTSFHRIIQVVMGEGVLKTAKKTYDFCSGLIIILPPNFEYTVEFTQKYKIIVIEGSFTKLCFLKDVFCLSDNIYNEGRMLAEAIVRNGSENEDYVITLLDAYIKYLSLNVNSNDSFNSIIHSITRKIDACYSDPDFDLKTLMSAQGYATDYVRAKFLKIVGVTPVQYLTNVRISNAKTMLEIFKDTEIQEVALRCGYYDAGYFTRCFKKTVGMSPKEYRNRR